MWDPSLSALQARRLELEGWLREKLADEKETTHFDLQVRTGSRPRRRRYQELKGGLK